MEAPPERIDTVSAGNAGIIRTGIMVYSIIQNP